MFWFRLPFQINGGYYFAAIALAIVILVALRVCKLEWSKCIAAALAGSYLFLLLSITVFSRGHTDVDFNILPPFWAYREIVINEVRRNELIAQVLMNLLILVPLGFLIPFITEKYSIWIGIGCSVMIEFIQLVTKRGYFEIDDIIHNTIGILVGFATYKLFRKIISGRTGSC